jgi:hypothetical protein
LYLQLPGFSFCMAVWPQYPTLKFVVTLHAWLNATKIVQPTMLLVVGKEANSPCHFSFQGLSPIFQKRAELARVLISAKPIRMG